VPLHLLYAITTDNFAGALSSQSNPVLPADRVIDWSLNWAEQIRLVQPAELPTLKAPVLLVGTSGQLGNQSEDLFEAPATVQDALLRGDQPLWSGNAREVPGVLVQAVLIQSLNLRHWLMPLSQSLCTAATAALGVVLAALLEKRQHRFIALGLIAVVACPLAWCLAIWPLWLVPLLLPLLALSATTLCRDD
jgi:CHASE2 domain-containing sensor protein